MTPRELGIAEYLILGVVWALLLAPLPATSWAWYRWHAVANRDRVALVVLLTATASYLLAMSGFVSDQLLGEHYSDRRYTLVVVNIVVAALALVLTTRTAPGVRRALTVTTCAVAAVWFTLAALSSVV